MTWQRHAGGSGWRLRADGRIGLEAGLDHASGALKPYLELDGARCPRTEGAPKSAHTLLDDFGAELAHAVAVTGVRMSALIALVLCESGCKRNSRFHRDPVSLRKESGFVSYAKTPHRVSAGLMQTLLSTARGVAARHPVEVAKLHACEHLQIEDLYRPDLSLLLGALYYAELLEEEGGDDVLAQGAYNAGDVYRSSKNAYRLRMYGGADRLVKFVAYHNDAVAALHERGAP